MARLPSEIVEFLLETSVFDVFDADLCAVVTGVEEAAVLLERLVAANLFLVPLDERARWYRYHHLFGALPRARLGSLDRSRLRAAHDRACRALEWASVTRPPACAAAPGCAAGCSCSGAGETGDVRCGGSNPPATSPHLQRPGVNRIPSRSGPDRRPGHRAQ